MKQRLFCALCIVLSLTFSSQASAAVNPAWVQALMMKADASPPPWVETFEQSAAIIAQLAGELPTYAGEDGPAKTAALLVSIGWFESHLKPDALGDCDKKDPVTKMCVAGSTPHSFCMFQIHETNFAGLGVTRDEIVRDLRVCTRAALRMVRTSFRVCGSKPREDRLDHYASGGNGCRTPFHEEGRHRIRKGDWLFAALAPF